MRFLIKNIKMKRKIIYITIIILIVLSIFYIQSKQNIENICGKYKQKEIQINSNNIIVDIADNDCKRELGLSNKTSIDDKGMLFIFENSGNYSFWMKYMNFPIDILWINDDFNIIGIEKNIATSTYPETFGGEYFSKYILELPAGFSDKNNIKVGDKIIYKKIN